MTRLELEARRMEAIPDLDAGVRQAKIARHFGVSRTTVSRWKRARAQGSELKRSAWGSVSGTMSPTLGRPPRLTHAHISACMELYYLGPRASGFHAERWTQDRFAKVIHDISGVEYDPDHVGKLMHRWGLRPKRESRNAE
jgi:transposase